MKCSGVCVTGKKCKKNASNDTQTCWVHETIECGICLKDVLKHSKNNECLECGHIFCKECIYTWVIEKENCPMCRRSVSQYFTSNANNWGLSTGLLREIQVTMYPLNQLDEFDFLFFASFCELIRPVGLIQEEFDLIESRIKHDADCNYIYEKLKKMSTIQSILVKSGDYNSNHIHLFIQ